MKKILLALLALALLAGAWAAFGGKRRQSLPSYHPASVSRGDIFSMVKATGSITPMNRLEVRPPLSGRIERILVQEGDRVTKGQILAWLSSTERAALVDAARAQGPEVLKRWEALFPEAPLVAPISGQVILRDTNPGQSVSAADHVVVLSDRLIARAQVDETDIAKVRLGQEARILLDAYPEQPIQARVQHIYFEAKLVSNVTIYYVDVVPVEVPEVMRSGMTANVAFITASRQGALLLPLEAVNSQGGLSTVLVDAKGRRLPEGVSRPTAGAGRGGADWKGGQGRGGKRGGAAEPGGLFGGARAEQPEPLSRSVKTGLDDGSRVEILEGLKEGEQVLVPGEALPQAEQVNNPFMMRRPGGNTRMPRGAR